MKRHFLVIGLICGMFAVTALTNQAQAQEVGGSLIFGSEIENLGIRADGAYDINEQFRGAADITFFFPKSIGTNTDWTWWAINVNGHYKFPVEGDVGLYGLAGLNFATIRVKSEFTNPINNQTSTNTSSNSEVGLNIGGGVEYPMDFGNLFGELKYTVSDLDQLEINAGVRIPIGN